MKLQIGTWLFHYHVLSLLGRGRIVDVFLARNARLGQEVALKALSPEFAWDAERIENFQRAVGAAARLSHPNIVTVLELGHVHGHHFYTTELMPGGDLKGRIRAHPRGMDPGEVRSVAFAMARALDYAHRQGFVHRGVEPENILFGADGKPKLTEFVIRRAILEREIRMVVERNIDSTHYMSPEHARGLTEDGRSDLYSLGVVLFEMLTGRLPFDAPNTIDLRLSHIKDPVPRLSTELAEWQPVLDRLLAKSPEDRFGSAGELAGGLAPDVLPNRIALEKTRPTTGESRVFDGIEFVWIPPGEFSMGSSTRPVYGSNLSVTRVRITRGFWLGKCAVKQAQWEAVMGNNPSRFKTCDGNCPVERVSWNDVQEFMRILNRNAGGRRYRLPTEAEWEYAARARSNTDTYDGDLTEHRGNDPVLNKIAWYNENSGGGTHPVGCKAPNAWGLHDMLGNVWEWVGDWYGDYSGGTVTDPSGPRSGSARVFRGGAWIDDAGNCRSVLRRWSSPGIHGDDLGFRLLRK